MAGYGVALRQSEKAKTLKRAAEVESCCADCGISVSKSEAFCQTCSDAIFFASKLEDDNA